MFSHLLGVTGGPGLYDGLKQIDSLPFDLIHLFGS
jgi:hypothetical protein